MGSQLTGGWDEISVLGFFKPIKLLEIESPVI
jgi:hypothetical protein